MHLSVVAERLILVVVFDRRSSVGLVRLRVRQAVARFAAIMAVALAASEAEDEGVEELTEADIESLFK
jgi:predicted regulator of Ras-like GTPase activity (Roadblock/LC7/MglB family)